MANQALQELIPQVWSDVFVEQLREAHVFGNVANTSFSSDIKKMGQEIEIEIQPTVTISNWTGGDLSAPEVLGAATTKGKITEGKSIHFKIKKADEIQALNNPKRAKSYSQDAVYRFANEIDDDYAALYPRAGIVVEETGGNPISIDSNNALNVIAECQRRVKKANISKNSKFFFIADPSFYANIYIDGRNFYTESGVKAATNGFMTERFGFKLYESNNCYSSGGVDYIYFGVEKECLAGAVQKDMELIGYTPELSVDNAFKGVGMYGVWCYDSRKFGVFKATYSSILPNLAA
jgi:hypothetical protein